MESAEMKNLLAHFKEYNRKGRLYGFQTIFQGP